MSEIYDVPFFKVPSDLNKPSDLTLKHIASIAEAFFKKFPERNINSSKHFFCFKYKNHKKEYLDLANKLLNPDFDPYTPEKGWHFLNQIAFDANKILDLDVIS